MVLSDSAVCCSKKSRFIKDKEVIGLKSSLKIRTGLDKITFAGLILFWEYKMNEILSKFLLAEEKFMSEIHLR